jgi:hypothetical protein
MMRSDALPVSDQPEQSAVVFPLHDPDGALFSHLERVTPALKSVFLQAYLSITPVTASRHPQSLVQLGNDPFFRPYVLPEEMPVGKHFLTLYEYAACSCPAGTILHLCFIDRLIFALLTDYREAFIQDVMAVKRANTPLIFQRSAAAWSTHPNNYFQAERIVTLVGELLLGKSLDYAWCHLAIHAELLKGLLPVVCSQDISMMAELVLHCQEQINSLEVDWLAWEDPFILGCDPLRLKQEREGSLQETQKRLAYVLPMVQRIVDYGSKIPAA